MVTVQEPYAPRPIRYLETWEEQGWRLKVYGIAYRQTAIRPELAPLARATVFAHLRRVTDDCAHYGAGFVGIHDGRGAIFIFVDFWADENELHHHVFVAPKDQPERLVYQTPSGLAACVWDLRVLCFERQAWIDAILANPQGPDLDLYLATHLNEDV